MIGSQYPAGPISPCPCCGREGEPEVYYVAPLLYRCPACNAEWNDPKPAVEVLTMEEARRRHPELYGPPDKDPE